MMRMRMEQFGQAREQRREDKEVLNKKLESLQEGMKEETREQRKKDREFLNEKLDRNSEEFKKQIKEGIELSLIHI